MTFGLPDIPDRVRESVVMHALTGRPTKDSLEHTLRFIRASWHKGETYQADEAFSVFELTGKCENL